MTNYLIVSLVFCAGFIIGNRFGEERTLMNINDLKHQIYEQLRKDEKI